MKICFHKFDTSLVYTIEDKQSWNIPSVERIQILQESCKMIRNSQEFCKISIKAEKKIGVQMF